MTAIEIDTLHKQKRKKNMKIAMIFIYALIFFCVLSLGHSLKAERDLQIANKSLELISIQADKLLKENENLLDYIKGNR